MEVVGGDDDRRKAEAIAREIENAPTSRQRARLENDDEERDLDKATTFDEEPSRQSGQRSNQRYSVAISTIFASEGHFVVVSVVEVRLQRRVAKWTALRMADVRSHTTCLFKSLISSHLQVVVAE